MTNLTLITSNDKAAIYRNEWGSYEVWLRLFWTVGRLKGQEIEPDEEAWGIRAWSAYSLTRAERIFDEITSGVRGVRAMVEEG